MKRLLPLLAAFGGLAAALVAPAQTSAAPASVPASAASASPRLKAGDVAPEFTVIGPKGETIKLSDFKGKVVIVDVSATWCGPCQSAMPNNDRVYQKYAAQGVVLLGVTADDAREAYDGWIQRNGEKYKFTMTFDPAGREGWKNSVFNTGYSVTGFPTMFIVGRDGKILETVSGGGAGVDYRLEYALARAGVKVDLASIPPEPKKDPNAPTSIAASTKTMAKPAGGGMIGMGGAAAGPGEIVPRKFGKIAAGEAVPDFTVTGVDGAAVKPSAFLGKPLLMHFVTGNGPQPWLLDIVKTYQDQGLAALVIFTATDRADFDAWLAKNPTRSYAVAWDPSGKAWAESALNTNFEVGMFPATVVVTADGKLVSGTIGMGDRAAVTVKMMLLGTRTIKPTEADLAAIRAHVQAAMAGGGMKPATPKAAAAPQPATLAAGALAPDFVMQDIAGKEVKLSDFKGKVVILDFWATWCGPCIASMPHTQEIAVKYQDQDVVVIASGTSDTIAKFKEWIPKNQPKFPNLQFYFDPNERGGDKFEERAASKLYHVKGIPTQFVLGRDGKIAATIVGFGGKDDARTEAALASVGVKVDEAVVAAGRKMLQKDAEDAVAAAAQAKDEEKNPKPAFRDSFGKLKAGVAVPDFTVLTAEGTPAQFAVLTKGKTVVLGIWSAGNGPGDQTLELMSTWQKKYADQGVLFLGIGSYAGREEFDTWHTANAAKIGFMVVSDPAGKAPKRPKPAEEMTEDEKKEFQAVSREYYSKVIPLMLSGGAMAPVPNTTVLDSQGRMVGFWAGAGGKSADSLGNLLLRAGIKLAPEDMPAKVFTAAETKETPPEPQVATLKVGALAPDFTTQDLNGKDVKLSDYRGKVVILDFWATWCGPCMASMPHTQETAAHYKDQGVVVLGSCTSDARANFEKWVKTNQEKYPDINWSHDKAERGADRVSHQLFGVRGIPTQFIIDRDGKVADIVVGYLKGEVLLDDALRKAGITVAPDIAAKAEADRKKRNNG